MTPEELLKKLDRLDKIPQKGYNVRGKPHSIQTVSVDGELLVPRWRKRCYQYKINLLNQFKKEACLDIASKAWLQAIRKVHEPMNEKGFKMWHDEYMKNN